MGIILQKKIISQNFSDFLILIYKRNFMQINHVPNILFSYILASQVPIVITDTLSTIFKYL